jgi:hypothetical protein
MLSMRNVTGRLIEIRAFPPFQREDFTNLGASWQQLSAELRARVVVCVDLRHATVLDGRSTSLLAEFLRSARLQVEREAIVLPHRHDTSNVGQLHLPHGGSNAARRLFTSPAAASEWLDEALTPRERARLTVFLADTTVGRGGVR